MKSLRLYMSIFEQLLSLFEQKKIFLLVIGRYALLVVFCTDGSLTPNLIRSRRIRS